MQSAHGFGRSSPKTTERRYERAILALFQVLASRQTRRRDLPVLRRDRECRYRPDSRARRSLVTSRALCGGSSRDRGGDHGLRSRLPWKRSCSRVCKRCTSSCSRGSPHAISFPSFERREFPSSVAWDDSDARETDAVSPQRGPTMRCPVHFVNHRRKA
jgi:hypothetical protein